MQNGSAKVSNPLSLMAIFAGLSEGISVAVLPLLSDSALIADIIWFTTWFPFALLILFFLTLNFNHKVLYSPSDFENQSHFVELIQSGYTAAAAGAVTTTSLVESFLSPAGTPAGEFDKSREQELELWIKSNSTDTVSLAMFTYSSDHEELRARFVQDKEL